MVSFELTPEQLSMQTMARNFSREYLAPIAQEYDEKDEFPWESFRKAHELGLVNTCIPPEYGAVGLDTLSSCLIAEEISAGCTGFWCSLNANYIVSLVIGLAGSVDQKRIYLGALMGKPILASFALTEPNAGSDAGSLTTYAHRQDNGYVISGSKCFITNGGASELYVVFAKTDRDKGIKGVSAFVVPGDSKGLVVAKKERKMGIRCSPTAQLYLEDVTISEQNLLGREGQGFNLAMQALDRSKPVFSSSAVGLARAAYEYALAYSKQREQFGRPIFENQAIQFMFADMIMEIQAARLLAWSAAWKIDKGVSATQDAAIAKCYATDVAVKVTTDCVQLLGGYGYMKDYPTEKYMRDAKILQIVEGTNQIQRMVIASSLL